MSRQARWEGQAAGAAVASQRGPSGASERPSYFEACGTPDSEVPACRPLRGLLSCSRFRRPLGGDWHERASRGLELVDLKLISLGFLRPGSMVFDHMTCPSGQPPHAPDCSGETRPCIACRNNALFTWPKMFESDVLKATYAPLSTDETELAIGESLGRLTFSRCGWCSGALAVLRCSGSTSRKAARVMTLPRASQMSSATDQDPPRGNASTGVRRPCRPAASQPSPRVGSWPVTLSCRLRRHRA